MIPILMSLAVVLGPILCDIPSADWQSVGNHEVNHSLFLENQKNPAQIFVTLYCPSRYEQNLEKSGRLIDWIESHESKPALIRRYKWIPEKNLVVILELRSEGNPIPQPVMNDFDSIEKSIRANPKYDLSCCVRIGFIYQQTKRMQESAKSGIRDYLSDLKSELKEIQQVNPHSAPAVNFCLGFVDNLI